jgi:tRNA(fMet)-specific endonuclease VapC
VQYLVDSDWVIDYLHAVEPVRTRLRALLPAGVGLSVISLAEVYEGVFWSREREADERDLTAFLPEVQLVPIDEEVCRIFAKERGRLRAAGRRIGDLDLFIGATALRHDLTLLTNNRRHFDRVEGLAVESA